MKNLLKVSAGAIALMTGTGFAMAQDSGAATGTQQMASDITCAQIVTLDPDELEHVLYFVAGYRAASGTPSDTTASAAGTAGTAGTATTTDTTASADMPDTDTSAGTDTTASADMPATDTTAGTDTTASADAGTDTTMETDTTASAADTDTSATGTDQTTTAGTTTSDTGAATDMLAGTGFFQIPVESVLTACRETPTSRVSDMMGQQGSGGTAQ